MPYVGTTLYPLLTDRRIVEPIWGGTRLAIWLDLPEPRPTRLGETWQVYDTNPILNGPLAGQTLAEVTQTYGAALVGTRTMARYGADFPLLAKFLDAGDRLSIQVHPNDEYAHRVEAATGFYGKTEAWYILDAEPGAHLVYGLAQPSSREELATAVERGDLESLLRHIPVKTGDVVFVPAGTLHAINAGIMLFEIQQKSDLTYRVYDYGRRDPNTGATRPLHLAKALDVIDFAPPSRSTITPLPLNENDLLLLACPYFALEKWHISGQRVATTDPGSVEILTVIAGHGTLDWGHDHAQGSLKRGTSLVLPATLGSYTLRSVEGDLHLLRAYVPDLEHGLIASLQAQGVDDARIAEVVIPTI